VRDAQVRLIDDGIAEQDQIEIERPRRTRVRPLAAGLIFDLLQRSQQLPRVEPAVAGDDRIQETRLMIGDADRIGFVNRRDLEVFEEFAEAAHGEIKMRAAVAKIRAESNSNNDSITQLPDYPTTRLPDSPIGT